MKTIIKREKQKKVAWVDVEYEVDQEKCINKYWLDYPREIEINIDEADITKKEKERLRNGETIVKSDRGGSYTQYYNPILTQIT